MVVIPDRTRPLSQCLSICPASHGSPVHSSGSALTVLQFWMGEWMNEWMVEPSIMHSPRRLELIPQFQLPGLGFCLVPTCLPWSRLSRAMACPCPGQFPQVTDSCPKRPAFTATKLGYLLVNILRVWICTPWLMQSPWLLPGSALQSLLL